MPTEFTLTLDFDPGCSAVVVTCPNCKTTARFTEEWPVSEVVQFMAAHKNDCAWARKVGYGS